MDQPDQRTPSPANRSTTPLEERLQDSDHPFELAAFKYNCSCHICHNESCSIPQISSILCSPPIKLQKTLKGFTWLLEKLSEISNDNPIYLNIPDIVLFRYGRAVLYVQTTRDRLLKSHKSAERLKIQEIIKSISSVSRTRKREEVFNNKVMLSVNLNENGKETACLRYMARNGVNDAEEFSCFDEDGALRVMNENEFMGLLWQRPSSSVWRSLAYIQSVLKCKNGIGESFIHRYYFGEDVRVVNTEEQFSEVVDCEMFFENPEKYCEGIFLRIYSYLVKFANIQLKSIQGEFVKDENNKIWLVHATFIDFSSKVVEKIVEKTVPTQKSEVFTVTQTREDLIYHLELVSKEVKNPRTEKLSQYMKEECEKIMKTTKFVDFFSNVRVDRTSLTAYQQLRPSNMKEFERKNSVKKKTVIPRCVTEQKKVFINRSSDIDTKSSSPIKAKNSWVFMPRLKFSKIQETCKRITQSSSKSPISSGKVF